VTGVEFVSRRSQLALNSQLTAAWNEFLNCEKKKSRMNFKIMEKVSHQLSIDPWDVK
jgi:hypothetical protein